MRRKSYKKADQFLEMVRLKPSMNNDAKIQLIHSVEKDYWISRAAKSITHYAFRNGPVETMHANGQLSQDDMKILNKFMVNRLAHVMRLLFEERWLEFQVLISAYSMSGTEWDEPEIDEEEFKAAIELMLLFGGEISQRVRTDEAAATSTNSAKNQK